MAQEIREIINKETWEGFLLGAKEKTFLHSWNWGEFQKLEGNKIWREGIYDNGELAGITLVVKIPARRGTFLFVPQGPVLRSSTGNSKPETINRKQIIETLLEELKRIAKKEKADFIRISPVWERNDENNKIFKDLGFREAPIHMHAEETWQLDVSKGEEEILKGMRKTTRYLIRQAEKNKDIEIIKGQGIEDLEIFDKINQETAKRHKFVPFSFSYLKNEVLSFKPDNQISVFLGKYQGKVVSSAVIVYWQDMGFYHHGASLSEYNKIPVSYLLQWEAIKEAKNRGCLIYNFWGISPNISDLKHPWAGLTLFKMGFGGFKKELVKTQDFPLSKKYLLTYIFEKARKIKRRL